MHPNIWRVFSYLGPQWRPNDIGPFAMSIGEVGIEGFRLYP